MESALRFDLFGGPHAEDDVIDAGWVSGKPMAAAGRVSAVRLSDFGDAAARGR